MALLIHAAFDSSLRESALAILLVLCGAMIVSAARLAQREPTMCLCHTDPFTMGVGNRGGMSGAGCRGRSDANGCGLDEV
jgi:hypothetical protein